MGRVGWLCVGVVGGIFLGKFAFSLPTSQVLVQKYQDLVDPIDVESDSVEFDEDTYRPEASVGRTMSLVDG